MKLQHEPVGPPIVLIGLAKAHAERGQEDRRWGCCSIAHEEVATTRWLPARAGSPMPTLQKLPPDKVRGPAYRVYAPSTPARAAAVPRGSSAPAPHWHLGALADRLHVPKCFTQPEPGPGCLLS